MLFKRLKRAGFNPEIAFVGCHCFVICNQYIIDVTATQYNYPGYLVEWNRDHVPFDRVEIIRYDTARLHKPWSGQIRFRSRELVKALDYQVDNGWPHDQLIIA